MKQCFYFSFNESPENAKEEAMAMRTAQISVQYPTNGGMSAPTVAELTDAFREFLKAAGYVK